jgi:hypothetical protein
LLAKDIDFCFEYYNMKTDDFISKDQRQRQILSKTREDEEGSFKKIEVRAGVCAAAILEVRLG